MSITFSLASRRDDGVVDTICPDADAHRVCSGRCDDPSDFAAYGYCECVMAAAGRCEFCSASVNVSNTNAAQILDRLGIEFYACGVIDPADLFGRAVVGNIGRDDDGTPAFVDERPGRVTEIDCGLRAGYFDDRLGSIAELASLALERGMVVAWG